MPRTGRIETGVFSKPLLEEQLGAHPAAWYVFDYLTALKAQAILVENHYVDRHFVDDFAWYYSRAFNTPDAHCKRLHFFDRTTRDELEQKLDAAHEKDGRESAERELQERYLGFVVVRPLPLAPLGRTVLRTYDSDNNRRHYEVVRRYRVNIAGIRLSVDGLAYQQQDRGAAVCASTALWSALQQVAHLDGQRTPTPSAVTRAAGSPFPASYGLNSSQMATALTNLGYSADFFAPDEGTVLFRAKLVSCLLSHLPVLLLLGSGGGGHAVAVTGFSEPPTVVGVPISPTVANLPMKAGSADVLYVHDDNLGSHAHYELFDAPTPKARLMLKRGRSNGSAASWWRPDDLVVHGALVPKPAKLRLPIEALLHVAIRLRPALEVELPGLALHFAAKFTTGVQYRNDLFAMSLNGDGLRSFHERLSLPRHIGVISVFSPTTHLLDAIVDVSEMRPSLLALACPAIPAFSPAHAGLVRFAKELECDAVATGPVAP
jgi:hypothetical protein